MSLATKFQRPESPTITASRRLFLFTPVFSLCLKSHKESILTNINSSAGTSDRKQTVTQFYWNSHVMSQCWKHATITWKYFLVRPNTTTVVMVFFSRNIEHTATEVPPGTDINFYLAPGQQSKKIKPGPPYK